MEDGVHGLVGIWHGVFGVISTGWQATYMKIRRLLFGGHSENALQRNIKHDDAYPTVKATWENPRSHDAIS
jgi:hypothetical protein